MVYPQEKTKNQLKKSLSKVLHMMQINTVTDVPTFSAFALMHQSISPPQPPLPRATAARGRGEGVWGLGAGGID